MASNISTNSKNAIIAATRLVRDQIRNAVGINGWQDDVDDLIAEAGVQALPTSGLSSLVTGSESFRAQLASIKQFGRAIFDPILVKAGTEISSKVIDGQTVRDWPRLFRELNADLLGGTPDYVDDRDVTFAADPAASAKGIFRRLTQDVNGQPIEDGYHNQTKTARIVSKPARYRSVCVVEGVSRAIQDALDCRAGRPAVSAQIEAVNDAKAPAGITNPYLIPDDLTDEADVATISGWTITLSGTPTVKCEITAANLWRGRTHAIRITGDNTEAIQIQQTIPASVFSDPYRPWDIGVVIKLESGWEGDIELKLGAKTLAAFDETNLTAGSYVMLFPDLDDENFPVNFDEANADFHFKVTNSKNNTQSIWVAAILPQQMTQHEGVYYSHYSHTSEPELDDTVTWADSCTSAGMIQETLSFLYHDVAPGNAHFPTSGTTTVADPTYTPEIGITRSGSNVADGGTIALGSVASGAHSVTLVIANTGSGALAVGLPVDNGGATNATLTDDGMTVPQAVEPGDTLTIIVEVTDGGAGAFSLTIRIDNNDASEGTYEITISGTAT